MTDTQQETRAFRLIRPDSAEMMRHKAVNSDFYVAAIDQMIGNGLTYAVVWNETIPIPFPDMNPKVLSEFRMFLMDRVGKLADGDAQKFLAVMDGRGWYGR